MQNIEKNNIALYYDCASFNAQLIHKILISIEAGIHKIIPSSVRIELTLLPHQEYILIVLPITTEKISTLQYELGLNILKAIKKIAVFKILYISQINEIEKEIAKYNISAIRLRMFVNNISFFLLTLVIVIPLLFLNSFFLEKVITLFSITFINDLVLEIINDSMSVLFGFIIFSINTNREFVGYIGFLCGIFIYNLLIGLPVWLSIAFTFISLLKIISKT